MTASSIEERRTLLSNLDYVTIGDVRTYTRALLVVREPSPVKGSDVPRFLLRGFGAQASMPTFDLQIDTDEFVLVNEDLSTSISSEGRTLRHFWEFQTLFRHATMKIGASSLAVRMSADVNSSQGIEIYRFLPGTSYESVWTILERKVARHWTAPFMQVATPVPIEHVRAALGVTAKQKT